MQLPYEYIVIVGYGRLGSLLAGRLSSLGCSVVVIDRKETVFDNVALGFSGFKITGDAAELDVLRQAKLDKADCLLAVTNQDNLNLMVAQVAKTVFHVPKVMARVYDPAREAVYSQFGIETISPTRLSADAFLTALQESVEVRR
jgi:trk system potassium uptake protein TrkA